MFPAKALLPCLTVAVTLALAGCGGSGGTNAAATTLTGLYGGTSTDQVHLPATLTLTATSIQLTLPCGQTYNSAQPLTPDGSGHFSVAGVYSPPLIVLPAPIPIVLSGTAAGDAITVSVTNATTHQTEGTFLVVKGKPAPDFSGACPD